MLNLFYNRSLIIICEVSVADKWFELEKKKKKFALILRVLFKFEIIKYVLVIPDSSKSKPLNVL